MLGLNLACFINTLLLFASRLIQTCEFCIVDEEVFIITEVMKNYSKFSLPNPEGVNVSAEFMLNAVTGLSEIRSEFEIDIFFSEIWQDPKLMYSNLNVCAINITLDNSYLARIWQPNICIVNSKSSEIHASPSPNIFLILYSDGRVWRNCRMKVTAPCTIDLKTFPFDQQRCTLIFESYSFNVQKVRLHWFETAAITIAGGIDLPDFVLAYYESSYQRVEYPNGAWDRLTLTFYFTRKYGFFVLQLYIPTYMTIFIAWISLWMDSKELATRATLTISAFLAMTLQFGNVLLNMPPVSYIKLIDLWMLGGIMFLFITLGELAVISHVTRSDKPLEKIKKSRCIKKVRTTSQNGYCAGMNHEKSSKKYAPLSGSTMSCVSKPPAPGSEPLPASSSQHVRRLASPLHMHVDAATMQHNHVPGEDCIDYTPSPSLGVRTPEHRGTAKSSSKRGELFGRWTPYQIDVFSLIGFTPLFLTYNIVYWSLCYYCAQHKSDPRLQS